MMDEKVVMNYKVNRAGAKACERGDGADTGAGRTDLPTPTGQQTAVTLIVVAATKSRAAVRRRMENDLPDTIQIGRHDSNRQRYLGDQRGRTAVGVREKGEAGTMGTTDQ